MSKYYFPLAFALNSFSMQFLVVVAGLSGHHATAADLSLAQAAVMLLFFGLSGNARNLILKSGDGRLEASITQMRTLLAPALTAGALLVAVQLTGVGLGLSLAIALRQLSEWFAELELARLERAGDQSAAALFLAALGLPLAAAAAALLLAPGLFPPLLYAWAALPLLFCAGAVRRGAASLSSISIEWRKILPNCGSTLVIGMVVFFFRLLISGFAGKAVAGQLFTAFAIGSMAGSVYERTIGPSFKVSSALAGAKSLFFRLALLLPVAGVLMIGALLYFGGQSPWLQRNFYLAAAAGFSLVGGYVMIGAQSLKIDLLHSSGRDEVFMADLLSNFAILVSVPVSFLLFGEGSFVGLYLLNALIVYACYWLLGGGGLLKATPARERVLHYLVAFAVVSPLFFQLGGGVYRAPVETYDWGGRLSMLPLPLSLFACFPLILALNYFRRGRFFSAFTFAVLCAMMCGIMASYSGGAAVKDKVLLSLQYLLPFFGLVLAELAGAANGFMRRMAAVFFVVTAVVGAAQIAVTFLSGELRLQAWLYFFTVYDNLQYAPVVLVCAYLSALFSLEGKSSRAALAFSPAMVVYAALSWSMLAVGILCLGLLVRWAASGFGRKAALPAAAALLIVGGSVLALRRHEVGGKFGFLSREASGAGFLERLPNVAERLGMWDHYLQGIRQADARTLLFGHALMPERKNFPSAHNYYLDITYNFGLAALAPVLLLIIYTGLLAWRRRREVLADPALTGLVFIVGCLVFLDNSLKVGFRQPYAGIFSFFLWGLLVTRLRALPGRD